MLIRSSTQRELVRTFSSVALVLLTCLTALMLVRTLLQASSGKSASSDVLILLGAFLLSYLPLLLALALYISVFMVFTRMWQDEEMAVWMSCGWGLHHFISTVLRIALPMALLVGLLMAALWPRMAQISETVRANFESRNDLSRLSPGKFQESADGQRIVFIENHTGNEPQKVFFRKQEATQEQIIVGNSGQLVSTQGQQSLELKAGHRVQQHLDGRVEVSHFDVLHIFLQDSQVTAVLSSSRTQDTWQLLHSTNPIDQAELFWRISIMLMTLNLALLALPMSTTQTRSGRSSRMLVAVLSFLVYSNLINFFQAQVAKPAISLGDALLLLHGSGLALALVWIGKRVYGVELSFWFWRVLYALRKPRPVEPTLT